MQAVSTVESYAVIANHYQSNIDQFIEISMDKCSLNESALNPSSLGEESENKCSATDSLGGKNLVILNAVKVLAEVISSTSSNLDLRLASGHLMVLLFKVFGSNVDYVFEYFFSNRFMQSENPSNFKYSKPLFMIALFHGVLCTFPAEEMFQIDMPESFFGSKTSVNNHLDADNNPDLNNQSDSVCVYTDKEKKNVTQINGDKVIGFTILEETLALSNNDDCEVVLSCIRLLNQWMHRVSASANNCRMVQLRLELEGELENQILDAIFTIWEHYVDRIKHAACDVFVKFLNIKKVALGIDSEKYFQKLVDDQMKSIYSKKSAVSAVRCIVKHIEVKELISKYPKLSLFCVTSMEDFDKASGCSDLIKAMFVKYAEEVSENDWKNYWIPIIFDNFKPSMMTFGFELLVKKFVATQPKCIRATIDYILKCSDMNYDSFMLLIMCVKVARTSSVVKPDVLVGNDELWKNLLPYDVIQECLFHEDYRVQLTAYDLLCTPVKTTEPLTRKEFEILLEYFIPGLEYDVPAQRQSLIVSTKRLFFRIKDSVFNIKTKIGKFRKQDSDQLQLANQILLNAKNFCLDLFENLLINIHSSSSYPRRACAIFVLSLYQEILFDNMRDDLKDTLSSPVAVNSLIDALNDDYEANKIIVLRILRRIPDVYSHISPSMNQSITCGVLSMSSSCKPAVTLTATYLLKFVHSNIIVNKNLDFSEWDSSLEDDDTHNLHISKEVQDPIILCKFLHYSLKSEVFLASRDLFGAAATAPMYGRLACLRAVLQEIPKAHFAVHHESWRVFMLDLVKTFFMIKDIVCPIVSEESPEGNIPMDIEILDRNVSNSIGYNCPFGANIITADSHPDELRKAVCVSAQMLLLCAWRSIKEMSATLGHLVSVVPILGENYVFSRSDVESIGAYFLSILTEAKHKGAFEQTYAGFVQVCETLWHSREKELQLLPQVWMNDVLENIEVTLSVDDKLCATRRSAGLPFIISAILSTEPETQTSDRSQVMKLTVDRLLYLAHATLEETSLETKLHSLNILRVIYRDSKLCEYTMAFAAEGVMAALEGFDNYHWSIRNSSTLLFAALLTRMMGVKRNKDDLHANNSMSAQVFFKRFPLLYDFLLDKLKMGINEMESGKIGAAIYPILLLLARLSTNLIEGVSSSLSLQYFIPAILQCSGSQIYQVRYLSARALVPMITLASLVNTLTLLIERIESAKENCVHGALLCIEKVVSCYGHNISADLVSGVIQVCLTALSRKCLLTKSVAADIIIQCRDSKLIQCPKTDCVLLETVGSLYEEAARRSYKAWVPGLQAYQTLICKLFLSLQPNLEFDDNISSFGSTCPVSRIVLLETALCRKKFTPTLIRIAHSSLILDSKEEPNVVAYKYILAFLQNEDCLKMACVSELVKVLSDVKEFIEKIDPDRERYPEDIMYGIQLLEKVFQIEEIKVNNILNELGDSIF